jgi:hypothetical protein
MLRFPHPSSLCSGPGDTLQQGVPTCPMYSGDMFRSLRASGTCPRYQNISPEYLKDPVESRPTLRTG